MTEESVGKAVLDSAFQVHTQLGPGLLESVYEAAMVLDLRKKGFKVDQQRSIPVFFDGVKLEVGFRADLIVNDLVLVELKSVESVTPLFKKIALNYLRLVPLRLGFVINFNEEHLRNGLTRIVNGLEGKGTFRNSRNGLSRDGREDSDAKPENFPQPSPSSCPSRDISL
jgi:GxxExxY protein